MPTADCHRFLHTNFNTKDVERAHAFYETVFGMRSVMRSLSEDTNSEAFGMFEPTRSDTLFAYDRRGGRRAPSLEFVQWLEPPTFGYPYPRPWDLGIQAAGFVVPDLAAVAAATSSAGGSVVLTAPDGLLLRDPDGVAVEVSEDPSLDHPQFRSLRMVTRDVDATLAWYADLGITSTGHDVVVSGSVFWPDVDGHRIEREVPIAASDDPGFTVVVTSWSGDDPPGPTYSMPFHTGLYRMAVAVDDVHASHAALAEAGVATQPPYTFQLPDTPITEGLTIAFLRDPDDVLVELVERPRSFFTR